MGKGVMILGGLMILFGFAGGIENIPNPMMALGVVVLLGGIVLHAVRTKPESTSEGTDSWTNPDLRSSADTDHSESEGSLTWHCTCGEVNVRSHSHCRACGERRPQAMP